MTDIYVTKYALGSGISVFTLDRMFNEKAVVVHARTGMNRTEMFHKPDWHRTRAEAISQANHMRQLKIKTLRKQISKMEATDFSQELVADNRWDGRQS